MTETMEKDKEVVVGVIPITDDNKDDSVKYALSMYLGEKCICGYTFENIEELNKTVWHPHKEGRISHKVCFEQQRGQGKDTLNERIT